MMRNNNFDLAAAGICFVLLSITAHAQEPAIDPGLVTVSNWYASNSRSMDNHYYQLALNDDAAAKESEGIPAIRPTGFEPPLFTGSKAHQYLGLGTLALVVATAIAPKPPEIEGRPPTQAELDAQKSSSHAKLGRAAATMAAATVATGLLVHWDDFHLEDGLSDPDNQHALLGTAGALAILYAVAKAPGEGHAGKGIAGGAAMAVAIKLTW